MNSIVTSPVFGVLISLVAYLIGEFLKKKTKLSIFNPLLISIIILICFLMKFNIKYTDYNKGGQLISFFLSPATVALALPFYKKFSLFKKNALPIIIGILCGAISGIIYIILFSKLFNFSDALTESLLPKSITTPIGMELSKQLGGIPSITVVAIIITGILGTIVGPFLYKILKFKDKVAIGIAMGACSHAIGTAKAMELGETEGAMSSLTMALSGIITVFLAPLIWHLFLILTK
ncbi:LrgB family protein [Clostridium felsineum]|uniref:LrgB family protein n=1 Tax=Clostridium felsineum TaxID=36839 RepID=UPI00098BFC0B|nr:LrgB family protein [Clostridium felsineum]URZ01809.1 Inner membrane protein YohK [Clostridium felsineum]URZ17701.1 Inner membrane protein YohK [Clostridium felsineum DSM 794]